MEHPKLSTKHQCLAYTNEHRRCRLERSNEMTCKIHRNYYYNWHLNHPLNSYSTYNTSRKLNELKFQLQRGYVKISKDFVYNQLTIYHSTEYLFLIINGNINPLWNMDLFNYHIKSNINKLYLHNIDIIHFNTILTSPEACIQALRYILKSINNPNWDYILNAPGWKQLMCSTILTDELKMENQNDTLLQIFLNKQNQLMLEQEQKNARLKEELLNVFWHPLRINKWRHELEGDHWS